MNRIKLSPLASSPVTKKDSRPSKPKDAKFAFDKTTIRSDQEVSLFGPLHYEKNHAYPLIVWLHSDGQKSVQLQTIMPKISMRNYVGVAPQAPVGNFECGYFWEQDYDSIVTAEESIFKATAAACSRFNIAPERIFLAGTGSGGTMALRMAMNHPARFAGAISLGGAMPEGQNVLARWREARQSPIFWAHHLDHSTDEPAAIEDVCDHFRKLFSFGFVNLVAREYPTRELLESLTPREIDKWIMEQVQTAIT